MFYPRAMQRLFLRSSQLNSSSSNLGDVRLSSICKELEPLGRSGILDEATELAEKAEAGIDDS